ncbi:MAG: hypothetical protein V7L23_28635 [Nostoc sp.]|uniref:hypothetical protein n=1 Tax=Nostoc sp. TaxID=1180 RepID=UPI002FF33FA8
MNPLTPHKFGARFTLNAGFNPVVLGLVRLNTPTPHKWVCNSFLTPHSLETMGRIALDTTRDGGQFPPFRLLCQVARAIAARSQLRITIHQADLICKF